MDEKFIERFSALQDTTCGYEDRKELTEQEFAERYPTKKEMGEEAKYWLEMYMGTGRGIGCISAEMRYDENPRVRQVWRNTTAKIKRFIATCEKEA